MKEVIYRYLCPNCGGQVKPVTQGNSCFNADQFDAIKAGDWYCTVCPEDVGTAKRSNSGFAYFWDNDIAGVMENEIVNDYFNVRRRAAAAHDRLLEMFGVSERNEYEITDLRDNNWHVYQDSAGVEYIRVTFPNSSHAGRVVGKFMREGLVLVHVGFNVGSAYFLLSVDKQSRDGE